MRRVKLETEVRQEQFAEAALRLAADEGMQSLNVAGVAKRVGLVPSALYRHFRSKDDLVNAVLGLVRERMAAHIADVCAETPVALERLHCLLMRHAQLIAENHGLPRIIFGEAVFSGDAARRARVYAVVGGYLRQVAEIIREGQQRGEIRRDLDPETAAVLFLGMVQPAAILWHMSAGRFDIVKHAVQGWKLFRAAIAPAAQVTAAKRGQRRRIRS